MNRVTKSLYSFNNLNVFIRTRKSRRICRAISKPQPKKIRRYRQFMTDTVYWSRHLNAVVMFATAENRSSYFLCCFNAGLRANVFVVSSLQPVAVIP